MRQYVFAIAAVLSFEATAVEFPVGTVILPPCTRIKWSNTGIFGMASPTIESAVQQVVTTAVIDVPNQADATTDAALRRCTDVATKSLGAQLLSVGGASVSESFSQAVVSCIKSTAPTVRVGTVFLRSETRCQW